MPVLSPFLGNIQQLLGGSKRKKNPKLPPKLSSPMAAPMAAPLAPAGTSNPLFFPILSHFGWFSCCLPPMGSALPTQMELWEVVSMIPALLWPGKAP